MAVTAGVRGHAANAPFRLPSRNRVCMADAMELMS